MGQQQPPRRLDSCPVCGGSVATTPDRLDLKFNVMVFACDACVSRVAGAFAAHGAVDGAFAPARSA